MSDDISTDLLAWYAANARDLPWRIAPGSDESPDPYRVWLSEIMLQQTTVGAVKKYYAEFTRRWPTVQHLAAGPDADILAAWAGLGYYARARNLIACARAVVDEHNGDFPDTEEGLRALPGVGDYTAAAIAAIAFGRHAIVVDANIARIAVRLAAIQDPVARARKAIRAKVDAITPDSDVGDFAQAMMDLGSRICTPRDPDCEQCPIGAHCEAHTLDIAANLPVKLPKRQRPMRQGWAYWIERDGAVLLVRRPDKGMLGGMRALPGGEWTADLPPLPRTGTPSNIAVQHVFTHFALELRIARLSHDIASMFEASGEWWLIDTIEDAGLPTLYRKAVTAMTIDDGQKG